MTEIISNLPVFTPENSEKYAVAFQHVSSWAGELSENLVVEELNRDMVAYFLYEHGANLNINNDEKEKFFTKHYSNPARKSAMIEVWGADRYKQYKDWCELYVEEYEERTGKTLPEVKFESGNTSKTEAMRGFWGDLTAYSLTKENEFSLKDLEDRNQARVNNGRRSEQGLQSKEGRSLILVKGYNKDKEFAPAGFPPEFPVKAVEYIHTWKK